MAITIEVSRGRYLRHLRDRAGINQRDLIRQVNDLLPDNERKTHQWFAAVEVDRIGKISVPMAIALHHVLGAEIEDLGVTNAEVDAHRRVLALLDVPPALHEKRPRGRPRKQAKRSSSCIVPHRPACPSRTVTSLPFAATHCKGWARADR